MNYSVNKVTSTADCDVLIELAGKEKDDLQYRKTTITHQNSNFANTAAEVEADLSSTNAQLTALNTVIAGLPAGAVKESNVTKQKRLELRAFLLNQKKENYGVIALLQNEMEQATVDAQIAEVDAFVVAVQNHKATLPA
ncbi:unnamed protein product [Rotaria sp. Silwood1]|nr:unnamed protein product [Rotaria sp. Silwood1]CAF4659608.1 unnamed protein product [Rotaria sp. Silwood1]